MASNAPSNPGTPKKNPHRPSPSMFAKYPGRWAVGGLAVAVTYLYLSRPPAPREGSPITFETPGVKNIGKAYTNAGATDTHTKAYGGTPLGQKDQVHLKEGGGTGFPNKKTPFEKEGYGDEQRPAGRGTKVEDAFNDTNLGSTKGK